MHSNCFSARGRCPRFFGITANKKKLAARAFFVRTLASESLQLDRPVFRLPKLLKGRNSAAGRCKITTCCTEKSPRRRNSHHGTNANHSVEKNASWDAYYDPVNDAGTAEFAAHKLSVKNKSKKSSREEVSLKLQLNENPLKPGTIGEGSTRQSFELL